MWPLLQPYNYHWKLWTCTIRERLQGKIKGLKKPQKPNVLLANNVFLSPFTLPVSVTDFGDKTQNQLNSVRNHSWSVVSRTLPTPKTTEVSRDVWGFLHQIHMYIYTLTYIVSYFFFVMYGRPTFTTDGESIWFNWSKNNYKKCCQRSVVNCLKEHSSVSSPNFPLKFWSYFKQANCCAFTDQDIYPNWLCLFRTDDFPYSIPYHIYLTTKEKEKENTHLK